MNKRILSALLSIAMLPLFGCTLAQPEETTGQTANDRLVGVMITTQYLDLFDMDAWLQDNVDKIVDGELVLPGNEGDARLYAELVESTVTDSDGKTHTSLQYVFEDVDGIVLAGYQIQPTGAANAYWSTDVGEGICDVSSVTRALEQGSVRELLGNLYVERDYGEVIFYLNPIYQASDGAVYLVPGTGLHVNSSQGGTAAQSVSQEITATENGVELTYSAKVEVTIAFVQTAERVVVIQMDENNCELARSEFIPGQLPDEFIPRSDTAYLLVEEHSADGVFRSLYQRSNDSIGVFFSPNGMLCVKDTVTLRWP